MALNEKFGRGKGKITGNNPNDLVYTPRPIAKAIINLFGLNGIVLDAFRGGGAFYDQLPPDVDRDWCEIKDGKDFFDYNKKVDWIVSNPPYSILDEVFEHSFEIAENVVYLLPLSKVFTSMGRIRRILEYGNIKEIHILSASKCGFPFGFPACAIWIKRNYLGETKIAELKI